MKRTLITLLIAMTLTTAAYAQRGRGFGAGPAGAAQGTVERRDRTAILKEALNLTDAQIAAIQALGETRRTRAEAIFTSIQGKRTALETLLNSANPNPADVGNAAIALHTAQKQLGGEQDWYLAELKKLLTGEQQVALDGLMAARKNMPVLGALGLGGPGGRGGPGGAGGPGRPGPRGGRGPGGN